MYFISNDAVEFLDRRKFFFSNLYQSDPDKMVRKITFGILHADHFVCLSSRRDIVIAVKIFLIRVGENHT